MQNTCPHTNLNVVLIAALSAMNSQLYITTRTMFSLARAGQAPRSFGAVSKRGIPVRALLLSSIGIALATGLNVFYPGDAFLLMMAISMFGALFTWFMIFVTHYRFRRQWAAAGNRPLAFRMRGFPVLTLLGAGMLLAIMLTTLFTDAFRMTLLTGIPFLAVLSVAYLLRFRHRAGPAPLPANDAA